MSELSDKKKILYRKLKHKVAFIYEINGKLYAISGNRINEIQSRFNICLYFIYKGLLVFAQPKDRLGDNIFRLSNMAKSECNDNFTQLVYFIKGSDLSMIQQMEQGLAQFDINYKMYCCA